MFVFVALGRQEKFLCSLGVGDHFGEFAAFGVTRTRSATVISGTCSTAYIITPMALSYAFGSYPEEFDAIREEVRNRALALGLHVEGEDDDKEALDSSQDTVVAIDDDSSDSTLYQDDDALGGVGVGGALDDDDADVNDDDAADIDDLSSCATALALFASAVSHRTYRSRVSLSTQPTPKCVYMNTTKSSSIDWAEA